MTPAVPMRILYLEDNAVDADLARRALARNAPELALEIVPTLAAARERLAPETPPFDLILSDLRLPDGSGLELLADVRGRGLAIAVVMITGSGDHAAAVAALKAGADDYLVKRDDYRQQLVPTLNAALARFRTESANQARHLRVLYAEHNAFDIDLARRHLAQHAPHVRLEAVQSGEEVLARLPDDASAEAAYDAYDVLLLDYQLPGANALEIAKILRDQRGLDLPVVLVTAQGDEEIVAAAMRLGVADYLVKNAGYLAALPAILEQAHRHAQLRRQQTELRAAMAKLQLYAAALASTRDAVIITDLDARILAVNPAFAEISGYAEADVLGQNPNLLQSHRQDHAFYQALWASLLRSGHWQGEIWNRRKNGEAYPQWLTLSAVRDASGETTHYVGVATDLTKLKHSEEQLDRLAHYDPLTDLPNRLLLQSLLQHALERAQRHDGQVGVLFINLDQFKTVNDSLGHALGDELLCAVGRRLNERLRGEDTLGRLGGDEFVVVLGMFPEAADTEIIARDLLAVLDAPFVLADGHEAYVRASIGISVFPQDCKTAHELLHQADAAMHRAKEQGGNQFAFYTSELNVRALERLEMEAGLRRALERGEFVLHYQPKVDLVSGRITGAEALLRWQRPEIGLVPPLQFIPLAEKSGQIVAIGAWVIGEVCRQIRAWSDAGLADVKVAVNVSARQFRGVDLEETVARALADHGVKPSALELELTESMLMEAPDDAAGRLHNLKRIGVQLSLDDFGTGYSSLSYLSRFPMDALKIDRSFVDAIVTDPSAAGIATSVIALAHRMQLKVVAEGVETEAQLGYLTRNHCDEMQGYYFSKPVPADDFATLLATGKALPIAPVAAGLRTLLVVDDEAGILSAVSRTLRGEGYRILTAGSAREGLELLASNTVQVILSDQRMPEMSGTEFLGRVKLLHPDTVRIVISGYTQLESIISAVNEGALYKFLTKPWDDDQLRRHIRDAFRYHEAIVKPRELADSADRSGG